MLVLALATLLGPAHAQETEFAGTADPAEEAEKPETELSAEVGFANASGNVEFWLLNGAANARHKWARNQLGLVLAANVGKSRVDQNDDGFLGPDDRAVDMQENSRRYAADARYDRFFGERNSLYVLAGAFVDPFAGYDLRTHEQIGYSRVLVATEDTDLKVELGADYAQENYVDELGVENQDIIAARLLVGFGHAFNESVKFTDTVEVYENVLQTEDVRVLNTAGLSSKLSDVFSLKLSHALIFDNVPAGFDPETETYGDNELRKLDMVTTATLVASIF